MIFVCRNKECKRWGVEDYYSSAVYTLINGKLVAVCAPCPCCGQEREEINLNESIAIADKNITMGMYSSASPEQRREMLKKRSHDHYEKEIKPRKEHQLHEMVEKFKNSSKD